MSGRHGETADITPPSAQMETGDIGLPIAGEVAVCAFLARERTAKRVEAIRRACASFLRANGYGFYTAHPLLTLEQLRERLRFAESMSTRALALPMDCSSQSFVPLCGVCHVPIHHIVEANVIRDSHVLQVSL